MHWGSREVRELGRALNWSSEEIAKKIDETRLRLAGWTLWRLADDAVTHRGHDLPPYTLLARRWKSGYICGLGELLRASLPHPAQRRRVLRLRELRLYLGVLLAWLALALLALLPPAAASAVLLPLAVATPLAVMAWRKRSWRRGLYALASWQVHAAGLLRGLLHRPRPPGERIASCVLQDAGPAAAPASSPSADRLHHGTDPVAQPA